MAERDENQTLTRLGVLQADATRKTGRLVRDVPLRPTERERLIVQLEEFFEVAASER